MEPVTTTKMLDGLHDACNDAVWRALDERYRPILMGFLRHVGLDPGDAAEIAQETFVEFVTAYRAKRYDRSKGRLRSWMIGIARNKVAAWRRSRGVRREQHGVSAIADLPDEHRLTQIWDAQCRESVLRNALKSLREDGETAPATIAAFDLYVIEGRPPAEVAETLGLSVRAVYLAKHRCLQRLKGIIAALTAAYELA